MTQALAASRFLGDAGHVTTAVMVGTSRHRTVPDYFVDQVPTEVVRFEAPTQVPDRDRLGVSVAGTTFDALRRLPRFLASGLDIHRRTASADVVVNFLDLVGGASRLVYRSRVPAICVAHNYLFGHPALAGAPGGPFARAGVRLYTEVTAARSAARVALSFSPLSGGPARLQVAPPLLRPGLDRLAPRDGGYLLAYALNAGYGDRLAAWQRGNPEVTVHCYLDGGADALSVTTGERFHPHPLDQDAFLAHLAGCRAYVGSAGFESLCEAHYLGKPVLAVPTAGQLEQRLNAWDAERCGVARAGSYDDLDAWWADPAAPSADAVSAFRAWVARAPEVFVEAVERVARPGRS
jgi:hypothetical protein